MYDGYPAHILDLQLRERNKILALGKEVARRESVLSALQNKLTEVCEVLCCVGSDCLLLISEFSVLSEDAVSIFHVL